MRTVLTKLSTAIALGALVTVTTMCAGVPYRSTAEIKAPGSSSSGFSPSLSFTVASFSAGDLDRVCKKEVDLATASGYTTMTLIPMIAWNLRKRALEDPKLTIAPGEISRCLEYAWSKGLNLAFQPHLDELKFKIWRAYFNFTPNDEYLHLAFDEFLSWLAPKTSAVNQGGRHVDVILAGELETSIAKHASDWAGLAQKLRAKFTSMGFLDHVVRVALNPNWTPLDSIGKSPDCTGLHGLLSEMDFIAFSAYGDWSRIQKPSRDGTLVPNEKQVAERIGEMQNSLASRYGCYHFDIVPQKPVTFGEFATGAYFWLSNHWPTGDDLIDKSVLSLINTNQDPVQKYYMDNRLLLYQNVLTYFRTPRQALPAMPLNIWTLGLFDPAGSSAPQGNVLVDPRIVQLFKNYSAGSTGP